MNKLVTLSLGMSLVAAVCGQLPANVGTEEAVSMGTYYVDDCGRVMQRWATDLSTWDQQTPMWIYPHPIVIVTYTIDGSDLLDIYGVDFADESNPTVAFWAVGDVDDVDTIQRFADVLHDPPPQIAGGAGQAPAPLPKKPIKPKDAQCWSSIVIGDALDRYASLTTPLPAPVSSVQASGGGGGVVRGGSSHIHTRQ